VTEGNGSKQVLQNSIFQAEVLNNES